MNHEIRIPIKQPGFNGKYPRVFFVFQGESDYGFVTSWDLVT